MTTPQLCGCGCGQPTPLAARSRTRTGHVKGQPLRYVHGHNRSRLGWTPPAETPDPAAVYAERLLEISELIVGAVHDDGPDQLLAHYQRALRLRHPNNVDPVLALVTVLAAQVDPDAPESRRLGWVYTLAAGQPDRRTA